MATKTKSPFKVTVNGRTVEVTLPPRPDGELVYIIVSAFDKGFARSTEFYIGKGGADGIRNRYRQFGEFFASAASMEASEVSVDDKGVVMFRNGRHRYSWLRDQGVTNIPVVMDMESRNNALKHAMLTPTVQKTQNATKRPRTPRTTRSVNQDIYDAMVRHQTYLMRYSAGLRNSINEILGRTEEQIAGILMRRLDTLKSGIRTPVELARLNKTLQIMDAVRGEAWGEATKKWMDESIALAYQEPIMLQGILKTAIPVIIETTMPAARLLKAIVTTKPFEGLVLKDWAERMQQDDIRRIHGAVQIGMAAGESMQVIASRVIGTGTLLGTDGTTEMTRRQVAAVTRTSVMAIANAARQEYFKENKDILVGEQYVATLDARTTMLCKSLDGQLYEPGSGPQPPMHFNCRSMRIAAVDGGYLGDRPAKSSTEKQLLREYSEQEGIDKPKSRKDLPKGHKGSYDEFKRKRVRELTGQVPSKTDYQTWLTTQSKEFQDNTLGITKAKLFREGKLPLTKFVDRNGSELTLSQLAATEKSAFRAAGLDPSDYL